MVVTGSFQEIYETSAKISVFNLPNHKDSFLKIEFGKVKDDKTQFNGPEPPLPFVSSDVFHASILHWRRLTADDKDCKPVYEVTFDVEGSNITFRPGDTIGILPQNRSAEVDFLLHHLNLDSVADLSYTLSLDSEQKSTKTKIPAHIPVVSSLRHVMTHCVDLRAVLKKIFILALSRYTKDKTERRILEYLCSKEGVTAYNTHILNTNTNLLDLVAIFKSCKPPIEVLFQHLPRLLPRPYSIVNSPLKNANVIKICFSVMDIGNNRTGLTTGWIEDLILQKEAKGGIEDCLKNLSLTDNKVQIYLRKNVNGFELPEKIDTPLVFIGPGTGVAPFIGFLEELEQIRKENCYDELNQIWIFFGCRNPELDFIYKEELNGFLENNVLSNLKTAFSRYENYGTKYVQDAIMESGEQIAKLIKEEAKIFVCGDLKTMAVQVKDAIVNCLIKHNGNTMEEAEKIVCHMQKNKKYIVDIWS